MYICNLCSSKTSWRVAADPVCGHILCMACFLASVHKTPNIKCLVCKTNMKKPYTTGDIRSKKRVHWGDLSGKCQEIIYYDTFK